MGAFFSGLMAFFRGGAAAGAANGAAAGAGGGLLTRLAIGGGALLAMGTGIVTAGGTLLSGIFGTKGPVDEAAQNLQNPLRNAGAASGVQSFMTSVAQFFHDIMLLVRNIGPITRGEIDIPELFSGDGRDGGRPPNQPDVGAPVPGAPGEQQAANATGQQASQQGGFLWMHDAGDVAGTAASVGTGMATWGMVGGGAAIGTAIFPGVGTVIGGALGLAGSMALSWGAGEIANNVVDWGERTFFGGGNNNDQRQVSADASASPSASRDFAANTGEGYTPASLQQTASVDMGGDFVSAVGEAFSGGQPSTSQNYAGSAFLAASTATPGGSRRSRQPRLDERQPALA